MTVPVPPFLSSSVYENINNLQTAGPAPGIRLIEETVYGDYIWRPYSFYGLSGEDGQWANFAYLIGSQKFPNGINLHAIPGVFNLQTLVTVPQNPAVCSLIGRGRGKTIFQVNAAGAGIYAHRTVGYGAQYGGPDQQELGELRGFKVDGTNAPVNTIGVDCGDGWGLTVDVACAEFKATQTYTSAAGTFTPATAVPPLGFPIMFTTSPAPPGFTLGVPYYVYNPTGTTFQLVAVPGVAPPITTAGAGAGSITGTIPLYHSNRVFWAEKQKIHAELRHNSIAALIDTQVPTHDHSKEYNIYELNIFCDTNTEGVIFAAGVNCGGSDINIMGNMDLTSSVTAGSPTNNVAALKFVGNDSVGDNSRHYYGRIRMKVEGNPGQGTGSVYPFGVWSDGQGYMRDVHGIIGHSLTKSNLVTAGVEFSMRGSMLDNSNVITVTTPAMPGASGTAVENEFPYDCLVYSSGGTGVSYTIGATVVPGITTGFVGIVPAGGTITPNFTTAPSWTWVPIGVLIAS